MFTYLAEPELKGELILSQAMYQSIQEVLGGKISSADRTV